MDRRKECECIQETGRETEWTEKLHSVQQGGFEAVSH